MNKRGSMRHSRSVLKRIWQVPLLGQLPLAVVELASRHKKKQLGLKYKDGWYDMLRCVDLWE